MDETTKDTTETQAVETITAEAAEIADVFSHFFARLLNPWTLYQIAILLGLLLVAYCLKVFLKPRIHAALSGMGLSKTVLRFCAILTTRLTLICFTVLVWATYYIMQAVTWPSRSYFIYYAGAIALAWLLIAIVTRLIRNTAIRNLLRSLGWAYAALEIVGLWEPTANILDSIAFETAGFRLSLLMVLVAAVTIIILVMLAGFLTRTTNGRVEKAEALDPSIRVLLQKTSQIVFYGAAILIGLKTVGFDLSNLAILTGAIGLGLGFGLQKIVSNLVSGVIILLDKSIKPGDVISLGDTFGWITDLGARYASITTRDGREYLVPNEDFITSQVINWTHSSDFVRLDIHFGVSYDSNPHDVKRIATEAPSTVARVVENPAPVCHIINFGDSSIDFKLRFWIKDPTKGLTNIRGNVYLALWDALKANNIEIPYPRRDVHMHAPAQSNAVIAD